MAKIFRFKAVNRMQAYNQVLIIIILSTLVLHTWSFVQMKKVECKSLDPEYVGFEYCFLKAVNRSYKYVSLRANLHKLPLTNLQIKVELKKRANGYKPFLYNFKFDACDFIQKKDKFPLINFFYNFFGKYSNINHSCPYYHDFIVEKMDTSSVESRFAQVLPFPEGDYAVYSIWCSNNIPRAMANLFVSKT